jgi:TetR/AcrR family transcriptional regulator
MSIKDRKHRQKEKRRNDILNAAEKLFFANGYDNVSLENIAKDVDLGRSTLYLYFENKEELFFAIVLRGTHILNAMIQGEMEKGKNGLEKLAAFRKAYYKFSEEYPDYLRVYNYFLSGRFDLSHLKDGEYKIELIEHSDYYSEYKKMLEQGNSLDNFLIPKFTASQYINEVLLLRREMLDMLCKAIKQGIDEGTLRSDVNPVETTVLLTLIANSIDKMPPDLKNLLEGQGIDHETFRRDVGEFIGHMVSNKGDIRKNKR